MAELLRRHERRNQLVLGDPPALQLVTQLEVNRLLIAAQQNMLAGESAAEKYRAAAQNYLDALAQLVTPGHLGELADQL